EASGNNMSLFDHHWDGAPDAVSAAEAARRIVATQVFALGGGVDRPFNRRQGPLASGYSVLLVGDNLFETLALNLVQYDEYEPMRSSAEDVPSWEQDSIPAPDPSGTWPRGY